MTLAPCLNHAPTHYFGFGYRCSMCGVECTSTGEAVPLSQPIFKCREKTGEIGGMGECLLCDAESGEACRRRPSYRYGGR